MSLNKTEEHSTMGMTRVGLPSTRMIVSSNSIPSCTTWFHVFSFCSSTIITTLSDTNAALHYYSHDNVRTGNGVLNITTHRKVNAYKAFNEKTKKFYADKKYIQSGMVQSWNKFCMIGGVIEFSASLPGDPSIGGLWPACKCASRCVCCCELQASRMAGIDIDIVSGIIDELRLQRTVRWRHVASATSIAHSRAVSLLSSI